MASGGADKMVNLVKRLGKFSKWFETTWYEQIAETNQQDNERDYIKFAG